VVEGSRDVALSRLSVADLTPPRLPPSDAALVALLRAGDMGAFETIFSTYHATLCEIVDAYVGSQAIAEEVVQDLFYAIWRDRERLAVRGSLRGYLCVAARNRAVQHLRHGAVALRWTRRTATESEVSRPPAAHAALEEEETLDALRAAIAALPPRARLAVVLRWRHWMSNAEVAESMGISVKGVEKLLATAMGRLREGMRTHRGDG
jgi:RNA polymerase sigma-70 factor (ECF subfamily)